MSDKVHREEAFYKILQHLVARGWIPLAQMATLMGYASAQSVYGPRKANPIATVRVGGTYRVYESTAIDVLTAYVNCPKTSASHRAQAQISLSVYNRMKRNGNKLCSS